MSNSKQTKILDQFEDAVEDEAWTEQLDRMLTREKKFCGGKLGVISSSTTLVPPNHLTAIKETIDHQLFVQPSSGVIILQHSSTNKNKEYTNVIEHLDISNTTSDVASSVVSQDSLDSPRTFSTMSQHLVHTSSQTVTPPPGNETNSNKPCLQGDSASFASSLTLPIKVNKNDVLCGRGKGSNNHPGNRLFRQLIAQHRIYYLIAKTRETKTRACIDIINKLNSMTPPGRFLCSSIVNNKKRWELLDERKAVMKTAQAFREGVTRRMLENFVGNNIGNLVRHRRRAMEKAVCLQKASTSFHKETSNQNKHDSKKKHPLKRRLMQRMENDSSTVF